MICDNEGCFFYFSAPWFGQNNVKTESKEVVFSIVSFRNITSPFHWDQNINYIATVWTLFWPTWHLTSLPPNAKFKSQIPSDMVPKRASVDPWGRRRPEQVLMMDPWDERN